MSVCEALRGLARMSVLLKFPSPRPRADSLAPETLICAHPVRPATLSEIHTYSIISPTSSYLGTPKTTCLGQHEPSCHPDGPAPTYLPPSPRETRLHCPLLGQEVREGFIPSHMGGQLQTVLLSLCHRASDLLAPLPPPSPLFFPGLHMPLPIHLSREQNLNTHLGIRAFLFPTYS